MSYLTGQKAKEIEDFLPRFYKRQVCQVPPGNEAAVCHEDGTVVPLVVSFDGFRSGICPKCGMIYWAATV